MSDHNLEFQCRWAPGSIPGERINLFGFIIRSFFLVTARDDIANIYLP